MKDKSGMLTETLENISNARVGTAEHTLRQRPAAFGVGAKARRKPSRGDRCVERK